MRTFTERSKRTKAPIPVVSSNPKTSKRAKHSAGEDAVMKDPIASRTRARRAEALLPELFRESRHEESTNPILLTLAAVLPKHKITPKNLDLMFSALHESLGHKPFSPSFTNNILLLAQSMIDLFEEHEEELEHVIRTRPPEEWLFCLTIEQFMSITRKRFDLSEEQLNLPVIKPTEFKAFIGESRSQRVYERMREQRIITDKGIFDRSALDGSHEKVSISTDSFYQAIQSDYPALFEPISNFWETLPESIQLARHKKHQETLLRCLHEDQKLSDYEKRVIMETLRTCRHDEAVKQILAKISHGMGEQVSEKKSIVQLFCELSSHAPLLYRLTQHLKLQPSNQLIPWETLEILLHDLNKVHYTEDLLKHLQRFDLGHWSLELDRFIVLEKLIHFRPHMGFENLVSKMNELETYFGTDVRNQYIDILKEKHCGALDSILDILSAVLQNQYQINDAFYEQLRSVSPEHWAVSLLPHLRHESPVGERRRPELLALLRTHPGNTSITAEFVERLDDDLAQIDHHWEILLELYPTREAFVLYLKENVTAFQLAAKECSAGNKSEFHKLISAIELAAYHAFGCRPRDTQRMALLTTLQHPSGSFLEIATGEGKTLVIAMLAVVKALSGQYVDIVTSSSVLARRDVETNQPFYELFDLQSAHNIDDRPDVLALSYQKQIVYGDISSFQRDVLQEKFFNKKTRNNRRFETVIVDEVDSMLLDKGENLLILSKNIPGFEHLEVLMVHILAAIHAPNVMDGSEKSKALIKDYLNRLIDDGDIPIPKEFDGEEGFVKRRLDIWIESAFQACQYLITNDCYKLDFSDSGNTIVLMDKDTGVELDNTALSHGKQQFLQLKHAGKFHPESLNSIFISNISFFELYKKTGLYGMTGTLGSMAEKNLLTEAFGIAIEYLPTFCPRQFDMLPPELIDSADLSDRRQQWAATIARDSLLISKNRVVLVINDSIRDATTILETLEAHPEHSKRRIIPYFTKSHTIGHEPFAPGSIIVASNLAGRGTDILIDERVKAAGGLHVILTKCPNNLRIEQQDLGRACRKGEPGSGRMIWEADPIQGDLSTTHQTPAGRVASIREARDQDEKRRIANLKETQIPKTRLQEKLFNVFSLHYEKIRNQLEMSNPKAVADIMLDGVLFQWAFWLDKIHDTLGTLKTPAEESKLMEQLTEEVVTPTLSPQQCIKDPTLYTLIGKYYVKMEDYPNAISYFDRAIKCDRAFAEGAYYYKAMALINQNSSNFKDARRCLVRAGHTFERRMTTLANLPNVIESMWALAAKEGHGQLCNEYRRQTENKARVYAYLQDSVRALNGSRTLDSSQFVSLTADDTKAALIFEQLAASKFVKPVRPFKQKVFEQASPMSAKAIKLPSEYAHLRTVIDPIIESWFSGDGSHPSLKRDLASVLPSKEALWEIMCEKGLLTKDTHDAAKAILNKASIDRVLDDPSVEARFLAMREFKTYLKELDLEKKATLSPEDLPGLLTEEQHVKKLIALLVQKRVLHPLHLHHDGAVTEDEMKAIVSSIGMTAEDIKDLTKSLQGMIQNANGLIRSKKRREISDGGMKARLEAIHDALSVELSYSMSDELNAFTEWGLDSVIKIENIPYWWGPPLVLVMGLTQIAIGVYCLSIGNAIHGEALIQEGIGDIQFAIEAQINGNFSWENYINHKIISVVCTSITFGISGARNAAMVMNSVFLSVR
ncbi:MAG: hypothetical protein NTW94_05395 [Legionellales bacterium]|nr:hypothetical protein [Legionellales bacterium]